MSDAFDNKRDVSYEGNRVWNYECKQLGKTKNGEKVSIKLFLTPGDWVDGTRGKSEMHQTGNRTSLLDYDSRLFEKELICDLQPKSTVHSIGLSGETISLFQNPKETNALDATHYSYPPPVVFESPRII